MKKQQKKTYLINGEFARLAAEDLKKYVSKQFDTSVEITDYGFVDDSFHQLDVLFFGTDELATKIDNAIRTNYELYKSEN